MGKLHNWYKSSFIFLIISLAIPFTISDAFAEPQVAMIDSPADGASFIFENSQFLI